MLDAYEMELKATLGMLQTRFKGLVFRLEASDAKELKSAIDMAGKGSRDASFKMKDATKMVAYRNTQNAVKNGKGSIIDMGGQAAYITAKSGSEFVEEVLVGAKTDYRILWSVISERTSDLSAASRVGSKYFSKYAEGFKDKTVAYTREMSEGWLNLRSLVDDMVSYAEKHHGKTKPFKLVPMTQKIRISGAQVPALELIGSNGRFAMSVSARESVENYKMFIACSKEDMSKVVSKYNKKGKLVPVEIEPGRYLLTAQRDPGRAATFPDLDEVLESINQVLGH
jgi:hypothetical protein